MYSAAPGETGILLVTIKRKMDVKRVSAFQSWGGVIAGIHGDFPWESWKSVFILTSIYLIHLNVVCFKKHSSLLKSPLLLKLPSSHIEM